MKKSKVRLHLKARTGTYQDFDVKGAEPVHRVVIPHHMLSGNFFNVYCRDGVKKGACWKGSIEKSLGAFLGINQNRILISRGQACAQAQPA